MLEAVRFEVIPAPGLMDGIIALPGGAKLTVACPPRIAADEALDVATALAARGFDAVPHLAARTIRHRRHLGELLKRARDAGITDVFVPGGDGPPTGDYESAVELLEDLAGFDHGMSEIGVGCYPEGHPKIPDRVLLDALFRKQPIATYMINQIVFDPPVIVEWLRTIRELGVTLPLHAGVPGVISIARLLRIATRIGVGDSLRVARKQRGMLATIVKRHFSPDDLLNELDRHDGDESLGLAGVHVFTMNAIASTVRWQQGRTAGRAAVAAEGNGRSG